MSELVMFLLVVQVLVGMYLYSFVLGAGQKNSNARATRIPDLVAVLHPAAAGSTVVLWILYLVSGETGFAWATLGVIVATAALGGFMSLKALTGRATVDDRPAAEPADVRVAEKQIPGLVARFHGLTFAVMAVLILLVALGVGD
ncbi:hypothetical protein [Nocardioides sp. SYSU DS0651]|uniref:hypothetical protein n=1 Tax=Nocardioides sp. SYSU DS0651 TaxID=3415955 RepID=UPI003F4C904D